MREREREREEGRERGCVSMCVTERADKYTTNRLSGFAFHFLNKIPQNN